jgi:beta-xylosidase
MFSVNILRKRKLTLVLIAAFLCLFRSTHSVYSGVPTAEHYDVFIEAEDVIDNSGFEVVGPPRALGYSGGKMLNLWSPVEPGLIGYFAKYPINILKSADYYLIVWAQGLDTLYSSPFYVSIDQTNLHFTKSTVKMMSSTARYGEDIDAHVMGPVWLEEGKHSLLIQVNERRKYRDKAFNLILDAIALSQKVPFQSSTRQSGATLTVDCARSLGVFSPMTDVSQGGIKEVTDYRFWTPLASLLRAIGTRNVRIDHIFDDNYYGIVNRNEAGTLTYHWDKLDAVLTQIIAAGARPYFCLSYMPSAVSKRQDPYLPPRDYRDWKAVCVELVNHVRKRFGLAGLYYEVWNEPDLTEFWKGSQQEYFNLYKASAEAIAAVDPYAKVGGPATAGVEIKWLRSFLEYIKRERLHLDFVSWHLYALNLSTYAQQIRYVKSLLGDLGYPDNTEMILSEWNIRGTPHPDNDAFYNAGHAAGVLKIFHEEAISKSFFFAAKDSSAPGVLHGEWGMVTSENRPKAVYNLFQTYARLRGKNLRVTTTDDGINAFATLDKGTLRMLVWSYDTGRKFGVHRDVTLTACLCGTGLLRKKVQKTVLRIDSQSGNLSRTATKHSAILEPPMNVGNYFEANFKLENGAAEYIELKQFSGGRIK